MLKKFLNKLSTEVKAIAAVALAAVLLISIVLSAGAISACTKKKPYNPDLNPFTPSDTVVDVQGASATEITGGYQTGTARAPQTSEYLGAVDKIVKPVAGVMDEHETYGVKVYPTYGKNLKGYTVEERNGLIRESHALAPSPTWKSLGIYNAIDAEGYLLKNGKRVEYSNSVGDSGDNEEAEGEIISGGLEEEGEVTEETGSTSVNKQYNQKYRKLYAHTASLTHFGGGLSDDEPRIIKKITAVTHMKLESTQLTGLYAPAGEVIKFEMTISDYQAAGGLRVLIGQNYNLYQHVSMETSGNGIKGTGLCRMPDILSIFQYDNKNGGVVRDEDKGTVTFYVGSFFGGPIYFRPISNGAERNISVTISGAVRYQHFILGATTKEEYEYNKESTAPYFDLEVYDSVRFTTHKYASSNGLALKDFTYENCTDAAVLWDKIAEVSTRVQANGLSGASAPVYIIGDCYIAAGAAFANPGRNGVVCPPGWLAEALNYNKFVNGGSWGTMHEYNHCWQGYGLKNGGEVTNNATTLISYSLYTKISAGRTSATGWGNGSWNRFTDPSKALGELLYNGRNGSIREDLSVYATLLHNIGQDQFIAAARGGKDSGANRYYTNLVNSTHLDMSYYFTDVLHLGVGTSRGVSQDTVNQFKDKNYPMFVPVSSVYQVGRSIVYDGKKQYITTAQPFSYGNGEFVMNFNNQNNFAGNSWVSKALVIPDGFTVTVKGVTQPANGTVTLLEDNKVKYTPSSAKEGLYSGNFKVTLGITKDDNAFDVEDVELVISLKQSASTTMSRTTYVYDAGKTPDPTSVLNVNKTAFDFGEYKETETIRNVCDQDSNSEIWATGINYYDEVYNKNSQNKKSLPVNQTLQTMEGALYFSNPGTYRITLRGRGKTALYLSYDKGKTWGSPFVIERTSGTGYVDTEYVEHEFTTSNNVVYYKVVHLVKAEGNFFGIGVASKQANGSFSAFSHATVIPTSDIALYEAEREDSAKKFTTEYRYKNSYTYSYTNEEKIWASGNKLISVSHAPWDDTRKIEFLFDGKSDTWYHSASGEANYITADKPLELVVDLGSEHTVNRVTFNGYKNNAGNNGMVKDFKIYGSLDGQNFGTLVTEVTNSPANAKNMTFNFDNVNIRYYKLVVTKTDNGRYFAMNSIVFSNYLSFSDPKGIMVAPNDNSVKYTGSWGYRNSLSNYGLIYTAGEGASVEFKFTGSRFAYFADRSEDYGKVDIYVDGKLMAGNVDLSKDNYPSVSHAVYDYFNVSGIAGTLAYIYDGEALANGEHTVKIVGKGNFNVESFAYWA